MKKRSNSRIGRVLVRIFKIRVWFDFERVKSFTLFVAHLFKQVFMTQLEKSKEEKTRDKALTESFEAAQKQWNLTDDDIKSRKNALLRLSLLMLTLAFLIMCYSGYHFFYGAIKAGLLSLVVMLIAIALAFRYHFWYYQFKSRQLGCSFNEWLHKGLLGGGE